MSGWLAIGVRLRLGIFGWDLFFNCRPTGLPSNDYLLLDIARFPENSVTVPKWWVGGISKIK